MYSITEVIANENAEISTTTKISMQKYDDILELKQTF